MPRSIFGARATSREASRSVQLAATLFPSMLSVAEIWDGVSSGGCELSSDSTKEQPRVQISLWKDRASLGGKFEPWDTFDGTSGATHSGAAVSRRLNTLHPAWKV
ncbi:hypothetical protein C8R44DRAFT_735770 [Mycena epipterygia]|nr:hypothetical protein C8R44DRAFT_735770 [Mycena epipterygia]